MSDIEKARELLLDIAADLIAGKEDPKLCGRRIKRVIDVHMLREPFKRGPNKAQPLTRDMALKIVAYRQANPEALNREIGRVFGVDGGRVTDAERMLRKKA